MSEWPRRRGLVISDEQMQADRRRACEAAARSPAPSSSPWSPRAASPSPSPPRTSRSDTLSLAALAASSFAATRQLAQVLSEREFTLLFHEGKESNLHVMQVTDQILLLITFGRETQVGTGAPLHQPGARGPQAGFRRLPKIQLETTEWSTANTRSEVGAAIDGLFSGQGD